MLKLAFTAQFPIEILKPEIQLTRQIQSHPSSWIQVLSSELAKNEQVQLHIVTTSNAAARDYVIKRGGIIYHVLKSRLPGTRRGYFLSTAYTLFAFPCIRMIQRLKEIRPGIVHGHGTEGPFSLAAVYSGFPNIISIQGIITRIAETAPSLNFKIVAHIERHTLRRAMAINTKTEFSEAFAECITPRTRRYFIEAPIHNIYWSWPIPDPARNIFFVGSIIKRKGIEEWIKAFTVLSKCWHDLRGYIIGSGPERYVHELKQMIASGPARNKIEFTGHLNRIEIAQMFAKGGIFCLPSHAENSPNSVMEAMAAGLPVVTTNVGNLSRMIVDQKTGFIVERSNRQGIKDALSRLLKDSNLHACAGRLGREIATKRWKPDFIAKKHLTMYHDFLKSLR